MCHVYLRSISHNVVILNVVLNCIAFWNTLAIQQITAELRKEGYRSDFAFIDGSHCLDHTLSDLVAADKVLDIGGLILFDDCADFGVTYAITYMDRYRFNLKRIKFESRLVHFLREFTKNRRRISVYQKVSEDTREANCV